MTQSVSIRIYVHENMFRIPASELSRSFPQYFFMLFVVFLVFPFEISDKCFYAPQFSESSHSSSFARRSLAFCYSNVFHDTYTLSAIQKSEEERCMFGVRIIKSQATEQQEYGARFPDTAWLECKPSSSLSNQIILNFIIFSLLIFGVLSRNVCLMRFIAHYCRVFRKALNLTQQ